MRIKRIWVSKYKNIKNLELNFEKDHLITLLVGQNGLGKSNLIEILSLIFRDLDLLHSSEDFTNWAYNPGNFEYVLDYRCRSKEVRIECYEGSFEVFEKVANIYVKIPLARFVKEKAAEYLPDYIVGYYSGENKRVKDIIKLHETRELTFFRNWQRRKREVDERGIRKLFFTESNHSQLILLTLAVYRSSKDFGKQIRRLFREYLKVAQISQLEIHFASPSWYRPKGKRDSAEYLVSNLLGGKDGDKAEHPFWGLKGKVEQLLTELYNVQIERNEPLSYVEGESRRREIIEFKGISFEKFSEAILKHFPHPIDFFYALEATMIIDSLKSIKVRIKKINQHDYFDYEQMSEGEQQLLTVLGLILITGKDDCLLLLDEPDTHLNPRWQRDYVELLKEFDINGGESNIIVATHSPLIVQCAKDANLVLFMLNTVGNIKAEVDEVQHQNWRADHVLTSPYFGLESARPKSEAIDAFMRKRAEIMTKRRLTKADKEELTSYLGEFKLFPTGETYSDLSAMAIIHNAAKRK